MSVLRTPAHFARQAATVVAGPRQQQYGDPVKGFGRIADVWNGQLAMMGIQTSRPIDEHDAVTLLEGVKQARRYTGPYNPDDYIDGAGLAACAGAIAADGEENRLAVIALVSANEEAAKLQKKNRRVAPKRKAKRGRR